MITMALGSSVLQAKEQITNYYEPGTVDKVSYPHFSIRICPSSKCTCYQFQNIVHHIVVFIPEVPTAEDNCTNKTHQLQLTSYKGSILGCQIRCTMHDLYIQLSGFDQLCLQSFDVKTSNPKAPIRIYCEKNKKVNSQTIRNRICSNDIASYLTFESSYFHRNESSDFSAQ